MQIFKVESNGRLKVLPDHGFKKEKLLQNKVAQNLDLLFGGLALVKSEFDVGNRRIDILAYDPRRRMFVIIECKKKDADMATQVAAYERIVKNHRSTCELALVKKKPSLRNVKLNWSKVPKIFVKSYFTKDEIEGFLPSDDVVLCEVREFSGGLIVNQFGKEPRGSIVGSFDSAGSKESTQYSESDWLDGEYGGKPLPETRALYFELKNAILNKFPKINHVQTQRYVGFHLESGKICEIKCSRRHLTLRYNTDRVDSLPINDFIETIRDAGHGLHRSQLRQKPDIGRALEYVGILYQSAGHSLEYDTEDENDRPREAGNQNVSQIANKVIIDKLSDRKEHTLQELYSSMFKALDGMSVPEKKAQNAMRSNLTRLKNAGKIVSVGPSTYKRA